MGSMTARTLDDIRAGLDDGLVIPYLGPGVLSLAGENCPLPSSPEALVGKLTAKASVPHKIRNNLTAAAQFIENFKHRKTVSKAMTDAFCAEWPPTALHRYLAAVPTLPVVVHAWYDDLPQQALAVRRDWGLVQGVSQSEQFGHWVHYFRPDGSRIHVAPPKPGHEGRSYSQRCRPRWRHGRRCFISHWARCGPPRITSCRIRISSRF
jgi:hypothetical protein